MSQTPRTFHPDEEVPCALQLRKVNLHAVVIGFEDCAHGGVNGASLVEVHLESTAANSGVRERFMATNYIAQLVLACFLRERICVSLGTVESFHTQLDPLSLQRLKHQRLVLAEALFLSRPSRFALLHWLQIQCLGCRYQPAVSAVLENLKPTINQFFVSSTFPLKNSTFIEFHMLHSLNHSYFPTCETGIVHLEITFQTRQTKCIIFSF